MINVTSYVHIYVYTKKSRKRPLKLHLLLNKQLEIPLVIFFFLQKIVYIYISSIFFFAQRHQEEYKRLQKEICIACAKDSVFFFFSNPKIYISY